MKRLLPFAILGLLGCGTPKAPLAAIDAELVLKEPASTAEIPSETMNDFAFRLLHEAVPADETGNALLSPLSVNVCLSMLANGANGETRDLVAKTLGIESSEIDGWNAGSQALIQQLLKGRKVDLSIANSLWTFQDTPPREEFVSLLGKYYGAQAFSLQARDQEGIDKINAWTKRNTRERIPTIIETFDEASFAVLVNAISFDGEWKQKFDKGETENRLFHLEGGATVEVPFMKENELESHGALIESGARALEIPYADESFRLLLLLPPDGTRASKFLSDMSAKDLVEIRQNLMEGEIRVALPRFRAARETDLKSVLEKMGAKELFKPGNDFSKIHDSPLTRDAAFVSQAVHKAFIEWDEDGTKAAAATMMETATESAGPLDAFVADRPFVYFLLHDPTDTILLAGLCNDPSK
ncbi:MAG TPA: serpin family protein [Fimbriimonas sp.]